MQLEYDIEGESLSIVEESSTRMQLGSILLMMPYASRVLFKDTGQDLLSYASI